MDKVKVLVVEDESILADSIKKMIEKMGYECVGLATNAMSALEMARSDQPDIALLDIRLKGPKTGIWLAEQIRDELEIPYIFMTSFSDRESVTLATSTLPYGYLVKPVDYDNVYTSIATALARFAIENKDKIDTDSISDDAPSRSDEKPEEKPVLLIKDHLFVKIDYQFVKITLESIDFVKSNGNYVEIHYQDKKTLIKETLNNLKAKLNNSFFQVHRSYVVNLEKIERIGGNYIMIDQQQIPITKERKDELLQILNTLY